MTEADDAKMHPANHLVHLGPDNVWGSNDIPVEDWEDPAVRVILSPQMQFHLEFTSPVIRWSRSNHQRLTKKHPRDEHVINDLSTQLINWVFLGRERKNPEMRRVILRGNDGRWYAVTFGVLLGSENVVSVTGSGSKEFVENRRNGMVDIIDNQVTEPWPER